MRGRRMDKVESLFAILQLALIAFVAFASSRGVLAAEMTPENLIKSMRANDRELDRVIIKYNYTDLTKSPATVRQLMREAKNPAHRKKLRAEYVVTHDPSIDATQLPDARSLFKFAQSHAEEIRHGVVDASSSELDPNEANLLKLLIEKNVSVSMKLIRIEAVDTETAVPEPPVPGSLAIQGSDFAVIHDPDHRIHPTRKFSSVAGRTTMMHSSYADARKDSVEWIMDSRQQMVSFDSYQELALWQVFAIGVSFGSRIKQLDNLQVEGDLATCDVIMEIWPGRESRAHLTIDRDRIVRTADIDCGITTIHVETAGLRQFSPKFQSAASGHFRRAYKRDSKHTTPEFRLELTAIEFNVPSEEFARTADFSVPSNEHVADVTHVTPKIVRRSVSPKVSKSSRDLKTFLLACLCIVMAVFGIVVGAGAARKRGLSSP